ncbi:MAG: membrane protein insertase YidC, partial [Bdellovibrionales bacterium]|nr:membrane protein insertase YidC [Bdellovibrionales bacterium]
MENNENSFLDKNTILAIALSILFFVGWQYYVQKKYPQPDKKTVAAQKAADKELIEKTNSALITKNREKTVEITEVPNTVKNKAEVQTIYRNENFETTISSYGMGFKKVLLKSYSDRENNPIEFSELGQHIYNFSTYYKGQPVNFNVVRDGERSFNNDFEIKKIVEFNPKSYNADITIQVQWKEGATRGSLETFVGNKAVDISSSMFVPAYEGPEFFVINEGSEERERVDVEKKMTGSYPKVTLASVGSQYFTSALLDESDVLPAVAVDYNPETKVAVLKVTHKPVEMKDKFETRYTAFVGPKKYDILSSIDPSFSQMINYCIFSVLSKPKLTMRKWLHGIFSNWGLSIIFLTIFIRLILLPINISSFKSMKKMQNIQPHLKAIKEKFKDAPQRLNMETMALMKKEKANPLGGCLPMLMQLPVFFALYSVLGQSVELYKSPFIFWIQDLSYKDPFYVLPIAVGGLYFIQMS